MNYRHVFHAGNFADVVKHATVALIVEHLTGKEKPFRVIDTHAGRGLYDLEADEAARTGEWKNGIGRLWGATMPDEAASLLSPYLESVRSLNPDGRRARYPGSPLVVRHLLRRQDRLTAIELHPDDAEALRSRFAGDVQTRVIALDGWLALGAHLPPKEKRGMVLVDPPFEERGEFGRMVDGLARAHRRWPGGIYAFWYPIKKQPEIADFRSRLRSLGIPKILDARLTVRKPSPEPRLDGSGMIVVNPPYRLEAQLHTLLPALAALLGDDSGAGYCLEWLAGETVSP